VNTPPTSGVLSTSIRLLCKVQIHLAIAGLVPLPSAVSCWSTRALYKQLKVATSTPGIIPFHVSSEYIVVSVQITSPWSLGETSWNALLCPFFFLAFLGSYPILSLLLYYIFEHLSSTIRRSGWSRIFCRGPLYDVSYPGLEGLGFRRTFLAKTSVSRLPSPSGDYDFRRIDVGMFTIVADHAMKHSLR
jgi:hypothetical protein